jgi:hypothetical protein
MFTKRNRFSAISTSPERHSRCRASVHGRRTDEIVMIYNTFFSFSDSSRKGSGPSRMGFYVSLCKFVQLMKPPKFLVEVAIPTFLTFDSSRITYNVCTTVHSTTAD